MNSCFFSKKDFLKAVKYSNIDTIQRYIAYFKQQGINLRNITNSRGESVLHVASLYRTAEIVDLLIDAAAADGYDYVNAKDRHGLTPIFLAIICNKIEIVALLINRGSDINVAETAGRTPLMFASSSGFIECSKLLLYHGADVNAQDVIGNTALHDASSQELKEIV